MDSITNSDLAKLIFNSVLSSGSLILVIIIFVLNLRANIRIRPEYEPFFQKTAYILVFLLFLTMMSGSLSFLLLMGRYWS